MNKHTSTELSFSTDYSRSKKWALRGFILITTLIACWLLAEIIFRVLGFQNFKGVSYLQPDDELTWVNKPLVATTVKGLDYSYSVTIDHRGFRAHHSTPAPLKTLFLLGDSTTFGQGVDDQDTWPAQLEETLNREGQPTVNVINAGVKGYGALQASGLLYRFGPHIRPSVIIYAHCGNDFSDDLRFSRGTYQNIRNRIPGRQFLREHSIVYDQLKPLVLAALSKIGVYNVNFTFETDDPGALVSKIEEKRAEGIAATLEGLTRIKSYCDDQAITLYITSVGFYLEQGAFQLSADAELIRQFCMSRQIPFLSPWSSFPATEDPSLWYNASSVGHMSPKGNAYFAQSIAKELLENNMGVSP